VADTYDLRFFYHPRHRSGHAGPALADLVGVRWRLGHDAVFFLRDVGMEARPLEPLLVPRRIRSEHEKRKTFIWRLHHANVALLRCVGESLRKTTPNDLQIMPFS
jgi:hypothetical protein